MLRNSGLMMKSLKAITLLFPSLLKTMLIISVCLVALDSHAQQDMKRTSKSTQIATKTTIIDAGNPFDESIAAVLLNDFSLNGIKDDSSPIKNYFSQLNKNGKQQMLYFLKDKTASQINNISKDAAMPTIHLYQALAPEEDEYLPTMLYIKGIIYAEKLDSLGLKTTINELTGLVQSDNTSEYISTLNKLSEKVKNYVPLYKKLDNTIWVADGLTWDNHSVLLDIFHGPDIIINTHYDNIADTMIWNIDKKSLISQQIFVKQNSVFSSAKEIPSQVVIPTASDSLYVLWCSERLDKNGIDVAPLLRSSVGFASAEINAELSQHNKYDFGSMILGTLATTAGEILFNSIIDAIFVPSKKMYGLIARLKIENEYLMTGTLTYHYAKISADGNTKYEDCHTPITLARWLPESGEVFYHQGTWREDLIIHPQMNIKEKDFKKVKSTMFSYWNENYVKKLKFKEAWNQTFGINLWQIYNREHYKWLILYNDSILKSNGINCNYLDSKKPIVGFDYLEITSEFRNKHKLNDIEGVYVTNIKGISPAEISGLKKDDVIIAVDGKDIHTSSELDYILSKIKMGDWLKVRVMRKKKNLDLIMRITWQ